MARSVDNEAIFSEIHSLSSASERSPDTFFRTSTLFFSVTTISSFPRPLIKPGLIRKSVLYLAVSLNQNHLVYSLNQPFFLATNLFGFFFFEKESLRVIRQIYLSLYDP